MKPICFLCGKTPEEIGEYDEYAEEEGITATEYMIQEEGTYNPKHNTFCCTRCYIRLGMPTAPGGGWKAPERVGESMQRHLLGESE